MKDKIYFFIILFLMLPYIFFPGKLRSNWIKNNKNAQTIQNSDQAQDTLPSGVTQDWLNNLLDENGNRIINVSNSESPNEIPDDPEGDAFQRKIFNGLGSNNYFGYSVASAGDVNGDGYDDIIVGAYGYNSNTGRAYLYYGGLMMNTVADKVFTGETPDSRFGLSVSSAGDVNGDGYDDIIVGAYAYNLSTGRAYLYFGGPNMDNTADLLFTGGEIEDRLGVSVRSAGDVNGDGYADVIIGADRSNAAWTGGAYIYFGGASMNNTADVILTGEATYNLYGFAVSSAGDLNGDGYSDVIVGAYGYSSNTGRAYVYFGGAAMNNTADLIMTGESIGSYFGLSVSSAGDVNGDGYSDVIVGASGYFSDKGSAYIYFGGADMNNTADLKMTGEYSLDYFGGSVSSAGDVNGDGYSDVIVGADGYISNTGKAYLFFGGISMNNTPDASMSGEATNNFYGRSVSTAGDVNGDGYPDLIVGAFKNSSEYGRVYLYDYFMKNEIVSDITITGTVPNARFGMSVATAGDVNGDGYSDVIVGQDAYSTYTGRAFIFFGGPEMDNIADVTMTGNSIYDSFGFSVSSAGDVNGDGFSDVIVGAYGEFIYNSYTGRAHIFLGGTSMDNVSDVTMSGETVGGRYGFSVSSAGDVNGDGYSDVIVGADQYSSAIGRAYIYFGGSSMNNTSDIIMTGEATGDEFGVTVSKAGDVNGDAFSDVIVGADQYSSNKGRAYIFFGGAVMNNNADRLITGEAAGDYFGRSVSSAGDVNSDGYSDVIIGAVGVSSNTGKSYVYFGGSNMDINSDVILSGESAESSFGFSVSYAGDVNGDGYSDLIVSAYEYSSWTGKAYVYFGGSPMDNTADMTMTGEATINYFGQNVSSAGDVNGDGYSDLIVSSPSYTTIGRAYIYLGSAISAKPILNFVKDVPDDQGGFVNLKWARSSFDVFGNNLVTGYSVYRSYPPSGGNFSWEEIAVVNPSQHSFYTYTASTPYDSGSVNSGNLFYKIRARTSNPDSYWESAILSGRSIDNIAPSVVSPFTAAVSGSGVILNWGSNPAPDLKNYVLFRSYSNTIDPYTESPLGISVNTSFTDTSPLNGLYYYFIFAQDIHGNYSPVAVTQSPNTTLELTMFIEGFYNAGSNSQISDTVSVELRNSTPPYLIADQTKGVVGSDGRVQLLFGIANSGNYYLAVTHRNSILIWSANTILIISGEQNSYDLSNSSSKAYGNNMVQIDVSPVRYGIYGGDENQNGTVDLTDVVNVFNAARSFTTGYVTTDMTGDNITDLSDLVITSNNASAFVSSVVP